MMTDLNAGVATGCPDPLNDGSVDEELAVLMRDLNRMMRAAVDRRLEPLGLSQAQWRPLLVLHRAGQPLTQIELARQLDIEAPTLVRLLDRLERKQWIERRPIAGDRRIRHIVLTASACELIRTILPLVRSVRDEAFADLDADQRLACLRALQQVRDRLRG
jgi:MarR family transcriptional regulator for hemolysin